MTVQFANYRVKDGDKLDDNFFNRRFSDIDRRIGEVEKFAPEWEDQVNKLTGIALTRIDNALGPAFAAVEDLAQLGLIFVAHASHNVTIGTGVKVFAIDAAYRARFAPQQYLTIVSGANPANGMAGHLVSYNKDTGDLFVNVTLANGSGTHDDWVISVGMIPNLTHETRTDNPHGVTKAQVGLGNVNNTADSAKPVSTAQQAAINAHANRTDNPHGVTKAQVGLGDVNNTADSAKPVSTAQQAALDALAWKTHPDGGASITGLAFIQFDPIPVNVNEIAVVLRNISHNSGGGARPIIRLGDGGGTYTTGYLGVATQGATIYSSTTEMPLAAADDFGGVTYQGLLMLRRSSWNLYWIMTGTILVAATMISVGGRLQLSAPLDRLEFSTTAGVFDSDAVVDLFYR